MDTLTSSEFRRRYASLTQTTTVTVNGHPIGEWRPARGNYVVDSPRSYENALAAGQGITAEHFNTKPFRPVPKKGK